MSIKRVLLLLAVIIVIVIALSFIVWYLINPEIKFFIYWVVAIIAGVLFIGAAIAEITGYSLRDFFSKDDHQVDEQTDSVVLPEQQDQDTHHIATLLYISEKGGEDTVTGVVNVQQIHKKLFLEYPEINKICRYLEDEGLIKHFDDTGHRWVITHEGVKKSQSLLQSGKPKSSSSEDITSHPGYSTHPEKPHKTTLDDTSMSYIYDVFLSHNSKDKPAVEELAERLEDEAEIRVFLDIWNLIPGDPWQEDLEESLDQSRTVVVFLGPSGIVGWHNEEMREALNTRVKDRERRVIPVLLPGTKMPENNEIPSFLGRLTWVDFREGLRDDNAFNRLVAGIKGIPPGRKSNR